MSTTRVEEEETISPCTCYLPPERERAVERSVAQLVSGSNVLVFGSAGMGKTHMGATIALRTAAAGMRVARIRPSSAGDGLSYGPVRPGEPCTYLAQPLETMTIGAVDDVFAHAETPTIVHVDDAHLFDAEHTAWLIELADRSGVTLLAGLDAEEGSQTPPVPELARLWVEERASRLDLVVFDRSGTDLLIRSLAGDVPIDTATRLGIHRGSGGIPLLIRELLREVTESGLVAGVAGTFVYPLPPMPSKRVLDLVSHRTRSLSDDERSALVVLARLEGIPAERAVRYFGDGIVRRLLVSGFVVRDETSGALHPSHRIEAETLLAVSGDAQLARMSIDVAMKVRRDLRAGVRLTPLEYVLIAETMLGDRIGSTSSDVGETPEEVAAIFLGAAGKCLSVGTIYSGLSFARASSSASPSVAALVAESRCLLAMGNGAGAEAALAEAEALSSTPAELGLLGRWRARLISWSPLGAPAPTDDMVEPHALGEAMLGVMRADWREGASLSRVVAHDRRAEPATRLQAVGLLVICLARGGQGAALAEAIELGERLALELHWATAWEQTLVEFERDAFALQRMVAQLIAGVGLSGLGGEIDERMNDALARHDFTRLATLGALIGVLDLCRGDYESADTELRLAGNRLITVPDARWTVWIPGLRVASLARGGRAEDAQDLAARISGEHPPGSSLRSYATRWLDIELAGGSDAGVDASEAGSGTREPGRGTSGVGTDGRGAAPDEPVTRSAGPDAGPDARVTGPDAEAGPASSSPHAELARMIRSLPAGDRSAPMARRAEELRAATDLALFQGMADVVISTARADAALLESAARRIAVCGYPALAATAASAAAGLHAEAGRRAAAGASESLAREYRARRHPRLAAGSRPPLDLSGLTTREREVVTLVADGRTNREVADALFLSVRTVESHFYQARMKLGAVSRQELTRLVRLGDDASGAQPDGHAA